MTYDCSGLRSVYGGVVRAVFGRTRPTVITATIVTGCFVPAPLSVRSRQAFQAIAVIATVMVVAIHYRSAVPSPDARLGVSGNALAQEFLLGGLCRVAVPLFAFAAGLFYFASCDGTLSSHLIQQRKRISTILAPYLMIGGIALTCWVTIRYLQGAPVEASTAELMLTWWLHPPAEQLWFLRDLLILSLLAPVIGWLISRAASATLAALAVLWLMNAQPFLIVGGWYLVNVETLLFFSIGCAGAARPAMVETITHARPLWAATLTGGWLTMVAVRVILRPDFDLWYTAQYTTASLVVHQLSIVVGATACLACGGSLRWPGWSHLSGLSFFVYLVHEFPLRAIVGRFVEMTSLESNAFWITAPAVTVGCFLAGAGLHHRFPAAFAVLTGGRTPNRAVRIGRTSEPSGPIMTASS